MGFGGSASAMNSTIKMNRKMITDRREKFKKRLPAVKGYVYTNSGVKYVGKKYRYNSLSDDYYSYKKIIHEVVYYVISFLVGIGLIILVSRLY